MAKKKTQGTRTCLAEGCNAALMRNRVRYATQYCEVHRKFFKKLRDLRQPCRIVGCKNPAQEDGYCDKDRPEAANVVSFRLDWLEGSNLIETNNVPCVYCGADCQKNIPQCNDCSEKIAQIRNALLG